MQPELISLMQQLVTAVQSIALSVDVISVDLRALNKNVAHLVKKESDKESSGLLLAPECSYTQNDDASSQVLPGSTADQMSVMEGTSSYHSPDIREEAEPREKYIGIRDSLREDIKKAMERSGGMDVAHWQQECREAIQGSPWEEPITLPGDKDEAEGLVSTKMEEGPPGGESSSISPDVRSLTHTSGVSSDVTSLTQTTGIPTDVRALTAASGITPVVRSLPVMATKKGGIFKCVWCQREFSDSYKLKRHWRVHTGERPFSCETCGKAFKDSGKLTRHKRLHLSGRHAMAVTPT